MQQRLWAETTNSRTDDYLEPTLVTDCNDDDAGDDDGVVFFWRAKEKLASIARAFREGEKAFRCP